MEAEIKRILRIAEKEPRHGFYDILGLDKDSADAVRTPCRGAGMRTRACSSEAAPRARDSAMPKHPSTTHP